MAAKAGAPEIAAVVAVAAAEVARTVRRETGVPMAGDPNREEAESEDLLAFLAEDYPVPLRP
ncbi:hypothetical protein GCM10027076_04900 [Nocardioides montaniterrae]